MSSRPRGHYRAVIASHGGFQFLIAALAAKRLGFKPQDIAFFNHANTRAHIIELQKRLASHLGIAFLGTMEQREWVCREAERLAGKSRISRLAGIPAFRRRWREFAQLRLALELDSVELLLINYFSSLETSALAALFPHAQTHFFMDGASVFATPGVPLSPFWRLRGVRDLFSTPRPLWGLDIFKPLLEGYGLFRSIPNELFKTTCEELALVDEFQAVGAGLRSLGQDGECSLLLLQNLGICGYSPADEALFFSELLEEELVRSRGGVLLKDAPREGSSNSKLLVKTLPTSMRSRVRIMPEGWPLAIPAELLWHLLPIHRVLGVASTSLLTARLSPNLDPHAYLPRNAPASLSVAVRRMSASGGYAVHTIGDEVLQEMSRHP